MKLERRDFLKALLASVVVAGSPLPVGLSEANAKAMIVGDGVADDTAALQRLIDVMSRQGGGLIANLNCRTTRPLHMRSDVVIKNSLFQNDSGGPFFVVENCDGAFVASNLFNLRDGGGPLSQGRTMWLECHGRNRATTFVGNVVET